MKEFDDLLNITDTLLGPGGCPWDRQQTLNSLRSSVLEEACELIEAIDLEDNAHIKEELGDLFFNVVIFCRLAEKENRCTIQEVLNEIRDKLIRRHPHVFGEAQVKDSEAVIKQWEQIKSTEKAHRQSALDSIPKDLPALSRAHKAIKKMAKSHFSELPGHSTIPFEDENSLGKILLSLVAQAQEKGLDAEHALRKTLAELEKKFRAFESN